MTTVTVPRKVRAAGGMGRTSLSVVSRGVSYVVLCGIAVIVLLPFIWMLLSSFKPSNEVFSVPMTWIPSEWQWHNYRDIWTTSMMGRWIVNTCIVTFFVTVLQVLTGSFAAYGFSRVRFPGRDVLFLVYIGTISVPWQAYMIPQFRMISLIGLTDTLVAVIMLHTFSAFGVFLMKQFFDNIPEEISEAARIDGLSEYGIYRRIILPLSGPAIASLAIIVFTESWNDYLGPLLYLRTPSLWTIQLGLQSFVGLYNTDYSAILTGAVISVLPVVVMFILGQRHFVEGIANSGLKG